jgi:hypothetical protein
MNNKTTIAVMPVTLFILAAILSNVPYLNTAYAQSEGPPGEAGVTDEPLSPFPEESNQTGPETVTEFEEIAGSDQAILENDTSISNPEINVEDATSTNEREECMAIPGNTAEDCP